MITLNDLKLEEKQNTAGRKYNIATVDFSIGGDTFIFDGLFVNSPGEDNGFTENLSQQIAKRLTTIIIRDLSKINNLGK